MEDNLLFANSALRYVNVVPQPSRAPKRIYRASCLGSNPPVEVWIRVYPNRTDGSNPVQDELRLVLMTLGSNRTHLVRYVQCTLGEESSYVVTQFYPNGSLLSAIVGNTVGQQTMQPIFRGIVRGIAVLHKHHLAHRRLSLEVVLLNQRFVPHLSKLSAVREVIPPNKISHRAHPIPDDLHHSPPEILAEAIEPDTHFEYDPFALDIWHLGVMLYRATNGVYPFGNGQNVHEIHQRQHSRDYHFQEDLAVPLMELINSMLNPNPQARPTIQQVIAHSWLR